MYITSAHFKGAFSWYLPMHGSLDSNLQCICLTTVMINNTRQLLILCLFETKIYSTFNETIMLQHLRRCVVGLHNTIKNNYTTNYFSFDWMSSVHLFFFVFILYHPMYTGVIYREIQVILSFINSKWLFNPLLICKLSIAVLLNFLLTTCFFITILYIFFFNFCITCMSFEIQINLLWHNSL